MPLSNIWMTPFLQENGVAKEVDSASFQARRILKEIDFASFQARYISKEVDSASFHTKRILKEGYCMINEGLGKL